MKCACGQEGRLHTPDYGYGYGAEYMCSNNRFHGTLYGFRFLVTSPEAQADSAASFALSKANAAALSARLRASKR